MSLDTFISYEIAAGTEPELASACSVSYTQGALGAFLITGAKPEAEAYLRAMLLGASVDTSKVWFQIYSDLDAYIHNMDFSLYLLLPDDNNSLYERALAFTQWCTGFSDTLENLPINKANLSEEASDLISNIREFSNLDCDGLSINSEDELAYSEVTEYARLGILSLFAELNEQQAGEVPVKH